MEDLLVRFAIEQGGPWMLGVAVLLAAVRSRPARTCGRVAASWIEYLFYRYMLHTTRDDARTLVLKRWDGDHGRS